VGDRDEEQARASSRQALAELRRSFGDPCPIDTDRERAGLRSDLISLDALEFAAKPSPAMPRPRQNSIRDLY
jgi:DNA-binding SARP family transcriptional activator